MRVSRDAIILLVLFVALIVGGLFLASPKRGRISDVSTTYNVDPAGVKAFYTLLSERLDYRVDRLRKPYTELPKNASVLFVVQPLVRPEIDEEEQEALDAWVRKGGTVVFLADNFTGIPSQFSTSRSLGKGKVFAFDSRRTITNQGMRNHKNALKLLEIIDSHSGPDGLILFDEYHHGITDRTFASLFAFMSREVKVAVALLAICGLVLCHTRGRRFGAVRPLPQSYTVRPGFEFVQSVARLYRRAHATDLAAELLCDSLRRRISSRFGLSPHAPADQVKSALKSRLSGPSVDALDRVLARRESVQAGQKPTESELVSIAEDIHQLEEELGLAGTRS